MNSLFVIAHATKEKRDHAVALVQECADHHANEVGDQRDQFGPIAKQIEGSKVGHNQGDDQQQAAIHDAGGNQVGSARLFGIGLPRMLASLEAYQVAGLRNSRQNSWPMALPLMIASSSPLRKRYKISRIEI